MQSSVNFSTVWANILHTNILRNYRPGSWPKTGSGGGIARLTKMKEQQGVSRVGALTWTLNGKSTYRPMLVENVISWGEGVCLRELSSADCNLAVRNLKLFKSVRCIIGLDVPDPVHLYQIWYCTRFSNLPRLLWGNGGY